MYVVRYHFHDKKNVGLVVTLFTATDASCSLFLSQMVHFWLDKLTTFHLKPCSLISITRTEFEARVLNLG